ncbi:MAG: type II toxin-antitoxin system VapC family toxin [Deltaproteobacteria bacterium]|nr:type II toxin-antitoxin system VapC family toxin [Deltaproteobacteria bacterium]
MLVVLDASVAVKWFVPGEGGRAEALDILDQVHHARHAFAVPELFFNEMLAVLARLSDKDVAVVRSYMEALQDLGFERIGNGRELLACAADLACAHRLTGYDAVYAASAKLTGGCWLTADAQAHRRVKRLNISKAVCQG